MNGKSDHAVAPVAEALIGRLFGVLQCTFESGQKMVEGSLVQPQSFFVVPGLVGLRGLGDQVNGTLQATRKMMMTTTLTTTMMMVVMTKMMMMMMMRRRRRRKKKGVFRGCKSSFGQFRTASQNDREK